MPDGKEIPKPLANKPASRPVGDLELFDIGRHPELTTLDSKGSQFDHLGTYTDPYVEAGVETDPRRRYSMIQDAYDAQQSNWDKLGNGFAKMGGSLADGILSTVGTIYGANASLFTLDETQMWDNPFSNLGHSITEYMGENFKNYQSIEEQDASAWSPTYWKTMNFFADNIIANAGYIAASYVTGFGISKLLTKLAPYIAGKNVAAGIKMMEGGVEMEMGMSKAYSAVNRWDKIQQGLSVGISAAGEASVEALSSKIEYKQKMTAAMADKYGGVDNIPQSVLDRIERDSDSVGNLSYAINIPILAGANMIQWGKSLTGFTSEFKQMSKNSAKLTMLNEFGTYTGAGSQMTKGISKGLVNVLTKTGKALKSNATEAAQEGLQFIGSKGAQNWYHRKFDQEGWDAVSDYSDPFISAAVDLISTKEGVANLLGGFVGGMPFGIKDYYRALAGDPKAKKLMDTQIEMLNNPFAKYGGGTIKENLKTYMQNMARHASAEKDLQNALLTDDEKLARDAKFDQMKSYIDSRIKTGRMDLLQGEMDQLRKLSEEDFKSFFNLDAEDNINSKDVLDKFEATAKEMHTTYKKIDRLFNPDMYRLNKLAQKDRDGKLAELAQHKEVLWSYMMDYKNRDTRIKQLDKEISEAFANALNVDELFQDQFKSPELNDLYRQYVAVSVEHALNNQVQSVPFKGTNAVPYKNNLKADETAALKKKLRDRIKELVGNNIANKVTMEAFAGENNKDYIDEYIFNIEKRILPVINDPKVQTALEMADMRSIMNKAHDLVELHGDKRMAIEAYNKLANTLKTGEYINKYVDNPDYDEEKHKDMQPYLEQEEDDESDPVPNPDYVPKKILSEDLLKQDGYKDRYNARRDFYKERREKEDANKEEIDQFDNNLEELISDEVTDKSKAFHKRVKEFRNGSKTTGGIALKKLSDVQLAVQRGIAERNMEAAKMRGDFSISTKADRDNFNYQKFIDTHAYLQAVYDEIDKIFTDRRNEINKAAKKLVAYVNANKIDPAELVPGFKAGTNQEINHDVVKRAAEMIAEKEAEKQKAAALKQQAIDAALAAKNPQKAAEEATDKNEPIIDDEVYQHFKSVKEKTERSIGKPANWLDAQYWGDVSPDLERSWPPVMN
jgi:hypothetical protein